LKITAYYYTCLEFVQTTITINFDSIQVKDGDTFFIRLKRINNEGVGFEKSSKFLAIGFYPCLMNSRVPNIEDLKNVGRSGFKNGSIAAWCIASCSNVGNAS